jgi:hypothetical protein
MPAFNPTKTYAPQSAWIREQIGSESHFGMVYPHNSSSSSGKVISAGVAKRGGFAFHTGAMVDLLESRAEVDRFFHEHPNTIVLLHEGSVGLIFSDDDSSWRSRIIGEVRTGKSFYIVIKGPDA